MRGPVLAALAAALLSSAFAHATTTQVPANPFVRAAVVESTDIQSAGDVVITQIGNFAGIDCWSVTLKDTLLYAAAQHQGLFILNVADPTTPVSVGHYDTPGSTYSVGLQGHYAIVADGNQLLVLDVATPSLPTFQAALPIPAIPELIVRDSLAYVVGLGSGLTVVDIAVPTSPFVLGVSDILSAQHAVDVYGDYAYVAVLWLGFHVFDITDPSSPTWVSTFDAPLSGHDIKIRDTIAYLAGRDSGLHIVDVRHPNAPTLLGTFDTPGLAHGIALLGDYALVADYDSGFQVIDVHAPSNPIGVGRLMLPGVVYNATPGDGVVYLATSEGVVVASLRSDLAPPLGLGLEDSLHVVSHQPLFQWTSPVFSNPQDAYELEVGIDSDWAEAELWSSGQVASSDTVCLYGGTTLQDAQTYWARLRVQNSALWTRWTELVLRMNSLPRVPVQLAPLISGEVTSNPASFSGIVGVDTESDLQQLQFSIFMDDSLLVEESPLVPATPMPAGDTVSWTATVPLTENFSYIWAVRAFDGYEYTSYWSAWRVFLVNAIQEAPSVSGLWTPQGDSIVYSPHPNFVWTRSIDPDPFDSVQYDHRVAIDSLFGFAQLTDSLTDTAYTQAAPLETGRRYWWKVISRDNHGLTEESAVETLRTYKPGDVNGSWSLTSADIITLVNYVFKGQPLTVPECAGRCNDDSIVSSSDIIWLVNTVFKGGTEPVAGCIP